MTSTKSTAPSNDFTKSAFRDHLDEQLDCLNKLDELFESLEFMKKNGKNPRWGKIPSQKNAQISIRCVIELQKVLFQEYDEPSFFAEPTLQDDLEREFGIIRALKKQDSNPNTLQFNDRTCTRVTQTILKDTDFDIFSLEDKVKMCVIYKFDYDKLLESINHDDKSTDEAVESDSNHESLEITWVAGTLAFRFKEDASLKSGESANVQSDSLFLTKSIKNGTIINPSQSLVDDVALMYKTFADHHPLPNLRPGPGLHANFVQLLVQKFPNRSRKLLEAFTEIRTNMQIKVINNLVKLNKKSTLRGARNLVETINS